MCDPVTIATTLKATEIVAKGYAAKQQGQYANQVAKYNARQQENEATRTRMKGVEEENIQREKTAQLLSTQRAQLGAAGVALESGSALDLQTDTAIIGEADALRVRSAFTERAETMEQQAKFTLAEGRAKQQMGEAAFAGSILGAGAGLMSAGVADKWFTSSSAAKSGLDFSIAPSGNSAGFGQVNLLN